MKHHWITIVGTVVLTGTAFSILNAQAAQTPPTEQPRGTYARIAIMRALDGPFR